MIFRAWWSQAPNLHASFWKCAIPVLNHVLCAKHECETQLKTSLLLIAIAAGTVFIGSLGMLDSFTLDLGYETLHRKGSNISRRKNWRFESVNPCYQPSQRSVRATARSRSEWLVPPVYVRYNSSISSRQAESALAHCSVGYHRLTENSAVDSGQGDGNLVVWHSLH